MHEWTSTARATPARDSSQSAQSLAERPVGGEIRGGDRLARRTRARRRSHRRLNGIERGSAPLGERCDPYGSRLAGIAIGAAVEADGDQAASGQTQARHTRRVARARSWSRPPGDRARDRGDLGVASAARRCASRRGVRERLFDRALRGARRRRDSASTTSREMVENAESRRRALPDGRRRPARVPRSANVTRARASRTLPFDAVVCDPRDDQPDVAGRAATRAARVCPGAPTRRPTSSSRRRPSRDGSALNELRQRVGAAPISRCRR